MQIPTGKMLSIPSAMRYAATIINVKALIQAKQGTPLDR